MRLPAHICLSNPKELQLPAHISSNVIRVAATCTHIFKCYKSCSYLHTNLENLSPLGYSI